MEAALILRDFFDAEALSEFTLVLNEGELGADAMRAVDADGIRVLVRGARIRRCLPASTWWTASRYSPQDPRPVLLLACDRRIEYSLLSDGPLGQFF